MKITLPEHLGGYEANLETDGIDPDEHIVGWVNEYGTITDEQGERIGDLVQVEFREITALVARKDSSLG